MAITETHLDTRAGQRHITQSGPGTPPGEMRASLAALAAYTVLALALTWPLPAVFTHTLPDGGDGWQEMWGLWWVKTALVDLQTSPYHTQYLYYPDGASLYFHPLQPVTATLAIPLQLVGLSLPAVYNVMVWFSFVAAGYGMYLLVRHLTASRPSAFVAGVAFSFCPYHFAHMLGQLNLMSIQWMPFYVLALFKAWGKPGEATPRAAGSGRLWWALAAGLLLAINAYTEWLYAGLMGLFTLWYLAWQLVVRVRGREGEPFRKRAGVAWQSAAAKLPLQFGVCLALVLPVLVPMLGEMQRADYMKATAYDLTFFSADLTDAVVPNLLTPLWRLFLSPALADHYAPRFPAERLVFVGYTTLLLAGYALWRGSHRPRQPAVWFWGLTALWAWVLSLGPRLHVWGSDTFRGSQVQLPYAWLASLPGFDVFRVPARISVLAMLALAVLVGYALAQLGSWHGERETGRGAPRFGSIRVYAVIPALAAVLLLVEFMPTPFPMLQRDYDLPVYHEIAREPGNFAIVDIPLQPNAIYMAYQTVHQRPIVGGYISRRPPDPFVEGSALLRYLQLDTPLDDPIGESAARDGVEEMRRANVRYVVVHWWTLWGEKTGEMRAKLERVFPGIPSEYHADGDLTVYDLGKGE